MRRYLFVMREGQPPSVESLTEELEQERALCSSLLEFSTEWRQILPWLTHPRPCAPPQPAPDPGQATRIAAIHKLQAIALSLELELETLRNNEIVGNLLQSTQTQLEQTQARLARSYGFERGELQAETQSLLAHQDILESMRRESETRTRAIEDRIRLFKEMCNDQILIENS